MTKSKFLAFEKVRKSGLTNMYNINEVRFIAPGKIQAGTCQKRLL